MSRRMFRLPLAAVTLLALLGSACSSTDDAAAAGEATVVVTTDLLGDVVSSALGDVVEVVTLMPPGADPHSFQASAQQAAAVRDATLLVVNGGGFEAGLTPVIESAEADGVDVFSAVDALERAGSGADPHFFTDPLLVRDVLTALVAELQEFEPDLDLRGRESGYVESLVALDREIQAELEPVASEQRVLVTNHDVFGPFADRYGFEVVGTIVPGGSSHGEVSGGRLDELADTIRTTGVPAIFVDSSSSEDLARTLADEVGDVTVVELYSEALGSADSDGATYLEMMRSNARRIAEALASP